MALWEKIQLNKELMNMLQTIYKYPFSIEIRHALAPWIEETFRAHQHLNPIDPNDHPAIDELMLNMATELEAKKGTYPMFNSVDIREHLSQCAKNIRSNYGMDRKVLFKHINDCLNFEYNRCQQMDERPPSDNVVELRSSFDNFRKVQIEQLGQTFQMLQTCQHELNSIFQSAEAADSPAYIAMIHRRLHQEFRIGTLDNDFLNNANACHSELQPLLDKTIQEMDNWKIEKKRIYEGKYLNTNVDGRQLEHFFRTLAEYSWIIRNVIKCAITSKMSRQPTTHFGTSSTNLFNTDTTHLENVKQKIEALLQTTVFNSFIINIQPHQMLKAGTKFYTTAQLLVGDQALILPQIKISLMNETQAAAILNKTIGNEPKCEIDSDQSPIEKVQENQYCAMFRNSKIKESFKRRVEKRVREFNRSVLDVNYYIYYSGQFEVDGITFNLGTFSYPVKVTTNGSQEYKSWETAIWDLATGLLNPGETMGRRPQVAWCDFSKALNIWFYRQTGRGLTQDNIDFIVQKLLPEQLANAIHSNPSTRITLETFCTDIVPGPGRSFSLWGWLFGIMKLITEHLRGEKKQGQSPHGVWDEGYVLGFVTAECTHEILQASREEKGFLLRFSPNALATITIEWIENGTLFCTRTTRKDLEQRNLSNRIMDIKTWQTLLSNNGPKAKDVVFQKYLAPPPSTVPLATQSISARGSVVVQYVNNILRTHVLTPSCPTTTPSSSSAMRIIAN